MNKKTFARSILRERSLAILYLIFALINDWVNSKVERLWTHLIVESLLKLLILLDICGYSAFFCLQKSLEEKIEELALRVEEEEAVLNELNNKNSPFKEQLTDIRNMWRSNILGLNIFRNINNIDNTVNINNNINNERNNLIN
jgi:hypothetical protein